MHPASLPDADLLAQCDVRRTRGTGPGGRHRNSTDSRVVLRHRDTGTEAAAGERRSQHDNLPVAVRRLRLALATTLRSARDPATTPSALWRSRLRAGRIVCSPDHRDFPSLLAEAMDVLTAHDWDVRAAGERLGVSPSQIARFVCLHGAALGEMNRQRASRGLRALSS